MVTKGKVYKWKTGFYMGVGGKMGSDSEQPKDIRRLEKSLDIYIRALELTPNAVMPKILAITVEAELGRKHDQLNQYLDAGDCYIWAETYHNSYRRGEETDPEFAEALYDKAIELDPNNQRAWSSKGRYHALVFEKTKDRKELEKAAEAMQKALMLNPTDAKLEEELEMLGMGE